MSNRVFFRLTISLFFYLHSYELYSQTIVIKAAHFIDIVSGKELSNQVIRIKNGVIEQVGPSVNTSGADTIIDLKDSWVMPGLIDAHVHLTLNLPYGQPYINKTWIEESNALRALRGAYNADLFLRSGFTTVKEIGSDGDYVMADIVKTIRYGWIQGPTIIYAGKIIAPYGGQSSGVNPTHEGLWHYEFLDADNSDEIVKAIRKNIYYGATTIKLVSDHYPYYYNKEDIKVAVDEAAKAGLKVTVHVMGGKAAQNVIEGGAAAIEHGFDLDEQLLQLMKQKGTFLVGTDFSYQNWMAYGIDSSLARQWERKNIDRLRIAYRVGVKMAFGTDVIIDLPHKNRVESGLDLLSVWKAADIPANYILKCMTTNAAELLGLEKKIGLIATGMKADIIALKKNPIDDIENVKTVHFVMKEGKIIR